MADIAWARKYRPANFDDYLGEDVKKLVINRFADRNSIPNTIMLYGTRGTGKTSMARLMAKEILCENPIDGHSCGVCPICQEINDYITSAEAGVECGGIIEVNAASETGKGQMEEIIDDALIPPNFPYTHKVLILDECHMLSAAAQNSLLKVIEEPPEHLIFILCTTDPEKVIATIHSRMQLKIEVKKKTINEMVDHLLKIAEKENLKTSREALQIIAKYGDRVPRECISALENVAKNYGNEVTVQNVRDALGTVSNEIYLRFYKAANTSLAEILSFNKYRTEQNISAKDFMKGLTRFTLDAIYIKFGIALDDYTSDFIAQIKPLFRYYKVSECDVLLQIIENASRGIDSDDTKSELIITTTALRIGKVESMSKGLASESELAHDENIASVRKYSEILEKNRKSAIEKIPEADIKKEQFAELFPNMADVSNSGQMVGSQNNAKNDEANLIDDRTRKLMDLFNEV